MAFKQSTKVNTSPAWTLADYAEKRGISQDTLRSLKNRNSDFPAPAFNAQHKKVKAGKKLYFVHEIDAWLKRRTRKINE